MRPAAKIAHEAPGRLRLRLLRGARQPDHLERIGGSLRAAPGVDDVQVNPATGAVLVLHHNKGSGEVLTHARQQNLFDLLDGGGVAHGWGLAGFTAKPTPTLLKLGALTLFGLAAFQARNGKFLPAGLPMIFQGLSLWNPTLHRAVDNYDEVSRA